MEEHLETLMSGVGPLHERHEGQDSRTSYPVLACPAAALATAAETAAQTAGG